MNIELILSIIIVAILVIAFIIHLAWQIKKKGLKQFVVDCIVKAEDIYHKGDNENKLNYVIDKIIAVLPTPLNLFITREIVKKFVQSVFDNVKKALDYIPKKESV